MSWLDKGLLLAAVAWCFLPLALPQVRTDGVVLLGGLLALTTAALVALSRPARASTPSAPEDRFVRFGNLAWLPAVLLTVAAGLLLRPLHDLASGHPPGSTVGLVVGGTERAVATVAFFLVAASVIHGALFLWSGRGGDGSAPFARPAGLRAVRLARTTGIALIGLGTYVVLLGLLVTLKDHTAADYWDLGGVAAPLLMLLGSGLWFLTTRGTRPETGAVAADGSA